MKNTLTALALSFAGAFGIASLERDEAKNPEPIDPREQPMIVSTSKRKFDLAPHLQGTRKRRRAEESGAVIEMDIP